MDADWISPFWQAFSMPARSRVCGIRVPPLSVWHVFALEEIGNPFLVGGEASAGDVQQLLFVATQTRAQFLNAFHVPSIRKRRLSRLRRRMLRYAWRHPSGAVAECKRYVDQSMRVPGRWVKVDAKACAVPHALHVLSAARNMVASVDAAWDMPYVQARCWFDVRAEFKGDDSIQSTAAQQMDERMSAEMETSHG